MKEWMKMQLMNETFRYDVLNNEAIYKKEKLIKTKLFISWKFTILKINLKNSPTVLPGCGTRTQLICTPGNLFPQTITQ